MTPDPAEDPCFHQEAAPVRPAPLVAVEAHLNSQEALLVAVGVPLIFPRAAQISQPNKTLQVAPLLPYPTHLDQTRASILVEDHHLLRRSPEDPGTARLPHRHLRQGGTDISLPLQGAPPRVQDQDSLRPLLHPRTTADPPFRLLPEGGLHFLTTGLHHHRLPWEVIGHPCPAMCPLLLRRATPNPLLSLPLGPRLVEVLPLSRRADRGLLLSHPPRLEETTTAPPVCPKGTAHSTAMVQLHLMVGQDLSLLHQTRDHHL